MTRRGFLAATAAVTAASAAAPARSAMGFSPDCFGVSRASRAPLDYIHYGYDRGAGGVQVMLPSLDPDLLKNIRALAEKLGMYLEVTLRLPQDDGTQFEQTALAAKQIGAWCLRSVCLSGRRYETFNSLAEWKTFVAESHARLARAIKIVEKVRIPMGLENHKDWTAEEMVPLLKQYSSEYLGTCIDWGNNMSLCDDPVELIEALAPWSLNSHIKDMAVEEYAEGFYLSEVALGQGMLPLKRLTATLLKAQPRTKFSLDMLTRNPLVIPCLTEKYWATFPQRNGVYLARMLRMVRANKPAKPLARLESMDQEARVRLEQDNVRQSVDYARDQLGLKI
ncbi:MAG: TIM barrel protein [Bryobacterales bacterium]|nr:TIM barrel protein [Bryobacterales bacterium]